MYPGYSPGTKKVQSPVHRTLYPSCTCSQSHGETALADKTGRPASSRGQGDCIEREVEQRPSCTRG